MQWTALVQLKSYVQTSVAAGRVKAVLHRVRDGEAGPDGIVPRRDAAIFFVCGANCIHVFLR